MADPEGHEAEGSLTRRLQRFRRKRPGEAPGTVVHTGERVEDRVHITVIDYDEDQSQHRVVDDIEEVFEFRDTASVTWVNVDGLHDTEVLERLGDHFGLHPLILEDIADTNQRPKVEVHEDYVYLVVKMLYHREDLDRFHAEQVSLVVGDNFVFSFQEQEGDIFDPVRERIEAGRGRIRRGGSGYLAYALIDTIVDHYFVMLEVLGDDMEDLEGRVVEEPEPETVQDIHRMKRELLFLRKSVWPLREVLNALMRHEEAPFDEDVQPYLRDVYDHTIHVIDTMETLREMVSGMLDIYLSSVNNRMSEVMKVLTIIATIFIPLTFVAGIYGMNFDPEASPLNMPELAWGWGYPATLLGMLAISIVMLIYFRRKDWI